MEKFSLGIAVRDPVWAPVSDPHRFHSDSLEETLVGGQAFRWSWDGDGDHWTGIWDHHVVSLRLNSENQLEAALRTPHTRMEDLRHYLGTDRIPALLEALPCRADPVLARLAESWSSLSLLRQPVGETLLAFICSSNKQIIQIRAMLEQLAGRFGKAISGTPFRSLPAWEELVHLPEAELRQCSLGYRAAHVHGTAHFLADRPDYLKQIGSLSLAEARRALQALPGVGPKVADCVLLFGFGRTGAFPVDTWIAKLLIEHYPDLANWSREQLATFARIHYGPAAGLAQQWLFADRHRSQGNPKGKRRDPFRLKPILWKEA